MPCLKPGAVARVGDEEVRAMIGIDAVEGRDGS